MPPPSPPTLAALASGQPPARARRAILRLSGPAAHAAVLSLTADGAPSVPGGTGVPPVRRMPNAESRMPAAFSLTLLLPLPLPALAAFWHAPHSYTGEDAAELYLPGNPHLATRLLARLTQHPGVRLAQPGEFTARAFLNRKLALDQAEGVALTIAAATDDDLAAARDVMSGARGSRLRALADDLTNLLALVEAGIDFTDQDDVVAITPAAAAERLRAALTALDAHLGPNAARRADDPRPRVALLGPPNAGKSTLFNALLGRRRSVTAPIPGTTRDALAEPLALPGHVEVLLLDLPGTDDDTGAHSINSDHRHAAPSTEHAVAHTNAARADILIHCSESGHFPPSSPTDPRPTLYVHTKSDRAAYPASGLAPSADCRMPNPECRIPVCSLDGTGLLALRAALADAAWRATPGRGLLPHHREALRATRAALTEALTGTSGTGVPPVNPSNTSGTGVPPVGQAPPPELLADSLRSALTALAPLCGRTDPDTILARVFSTFCIGK